MVSNIALKYCSSGNPFQMLNPNWENCLREVLLKIISNFNGDNVSIPNHKGYVTLVYFTRT